MGDGGAEAPGSAKPVFKGGGGGARRQIRKRKADSDEEDDKSAAPAARQAPAPQATPAGAGAAAPAGEKVKKKVESSLSFDMDEEADADDSAFAAKKKADRKRNEKVQSAYASAGGSYSAAELAELSKNARSFKGPIVTPMPGAGAGVGALDGLDIKREKKSKREAGGEAVRMKPLQIPVKREEDSYDAPPPRVGGSLMRGGNAGLNKQAAEDLRATMARPDADMDVDPGAGAGGIPSKEQIERLKARREQARKMGAAAGPAAQGKGAKEFIPIAGDEDERKHAHSRVVRESADDHEDSIVAEDLGADGPRMSFGRGESAAQRRRAAMAMAEAEAQDGTDDSDEDGNFAAMQARAGHGRADAGADTGRRGGHQTMTEVQHRLQGHLDQLRQEHQAASARLREVEAKLVAAEAESAGVQVGMQDAQARYTFFQETRAYLQDLLECLDVKAPLLEEIEEDMAQARRRRSDALRKRRSHDANDGVQAALEALGKGAASTELDEFGRDPSMARERRMRARAERRKDTAERRRRLRGGAQEEPIGTREQLVEDMWTSDESDSELAEWRKARAELAVQADELFGDVRREFRDLKAIHARMQQWKARFPKSYREAWVAMSLPRLLAPYVRKETVAWEPLNGQTLESLPWVSDLFPADEAAAEASEDDDVIPNLVKEVICPKVAEALRSEWDPSSSGATARAVALLNDVLVFVLDAAPDAARALCDLVPATLSVELDRCTAGAALFLKEPGAASARAALAAARESFVRCCKLVRNAGAWREVVSPAALQAFVFDEVATRHLVPLLRALQKKHTQDALDLARLLRESVPPEWHERPGMRQILDCCK